VLLDEQIASNRRRSVLYLVLFFVVWVGIGALGGLIFASSSSSSTGNGYYDQYGYYHPDTTTTTSSSSTAGPVLTGVVIFGGLALLGIAYSLRSGTSLVLRASGARPADPQQYLQLHNLVESLAIGDGIPKPAVYVIDDPSPNAFATGTSPDRAAITATTGLLAIMNRDELEGVISHEMSHIKNYDVRLLLIVTTLIGLAALIASMVWRWAFFMRPRGRDGEQMMLVVLAAAALLSVVAFIFGPLIRLALSRRREELADVSGAELTRNPAGLISALRKLQANDKPFAKFNHATAAMCIDDPLQHHESWFHHLFDTHPPIEERIAILEHIEQGAAGH
jgi:heat shock protein HtpX